VLVVVPGTLLGAFFAGTLAVFHHTFGIFIVRRKQLGGSTAYFCTGPVGPDAVDHHLDVAGVQAGIRTMVAVGYAVVQNFNQL